MSDVRKELNFCKKTGLRVLGVVENMSGYLCPCCGHKSDIFPAAGEGPKGMADAFAVPFLGAVPIDPLLLSSCESGDAYITKHPHARGVPAFLSVVGNIVQQVEGAGASLEAPYSTAGAPGGSGGDASTSTAAAAAAAGEGGEQQGKAAEGEAGEGTATSAPTTSSSNNKNGA